MMSFRFFPSGTLARYMARTFLTRSLGVLAMLVIVLQTLDLLGTSADILAHPGNGQAEVWHYVALRLPQIVARFLPFAVLLGTLITLATLNQNEAADYGPVPPTKGTATNVWVRSGDDLIHAVDARGRRAGTRLTDVAVYDRTGGRLEHIVRAASARPVPMGWRLTKVVRFDVDTGHRTATPYLDVKIDVRPDQFTLAEVSADDRSFRTLQRDIVYLDGAGRPTGPLRAGLWHKFSSPLAVVLMPLLAGVAAFGLARSGALFVRVVIGMGLGFTYFVADNFALAMGNLGAYPPLLAAWAPFLLFLLIGEAVLLRTEE